MLRDYQIDICNRIKEALVLHRSVMAQMPTGTGKTVVLAEMVSIFQNIMGMGNIVIVAHRKELVEQIKESIARLSNLTSDCLYVHSIQWLNRNIEAVGVPDIVIIDEAHHALAKTYKRMWEVWPKTRFLGLTATPCRLNGSGFTDLFDALVMSWDIPTFIKKNWLATYDFISIKTNGYTHSLISSLKKRGADGDFQLKEMDAVLNKKTSIERLFYSFLTYAKNRKGIIYAINIRHARSIAEFYQSMGISAVAIDSNTPANERAQMLEDFKASKGNSSRDIQVLVNVDIFSEGFDCPDVEFIQLARPTLSLAKYLQMVGRGLRVCEGKKNCLIIDNVGIYNAFGLPSQIWNWERMFKGNRVQSAMAAMRVACPEVYYIPDFNAETPDSSNKCHDNEMVVVVTHEQLDDSFEQQKRDEKLDNERKAILNGANGRVRMVGRELAELNEGRNKKPSYVDLINMNLFRHSAEGRPTVTRLGEIEFLRFGSRLVSRTRVPISLPYFYLCIERHSFYSMHIGTEEKNMDCLVFNSSGYKSGARAVVFLHDEPMEFFWMAGTVKGGGLIIMGRNGCYFFAEKGRGRRYLGCADCEENRINIIDTVMGIMKAAEENVNSDDLKNGHASAALAKPYKAGVKWGLRGDDGRIVTPPIYRCIKEENGFFLFEQLPLHWGVMDRLGHVIIEAKHDKVAVSADGKAIITSLSGKQTVVDLK